MDESGNSNADYNEEFVYRDSLECPIEETLKVKNAFPESPKTSEEHGCVPLSNNLGSDTIDKGGKLRNDRIDRKKGNSIRPREKNLIKLNKETIQKGQMKKSYREMHQKKLGKKASIKNKGQNEASQINDLRNTNAAAEFRKQTLLLDGILTENDGLNSSNGLNDKMFHFGNSGIQEANEFSGLIALEKDEYNLESTRCNETNLSQLGGREIGYEHQLPTLRNFSSVQSAPADIQPYQNPFILGEGYTDVNSMTYLTSMRSHSELVNSNTTYTGIYANAKQNSRASNYKPYTLSDYKKIKRESKPGGLGPDTKSEEHQQKTKTAIRKKEYSAAVRQRNASENFNGMRKKQKSPGKQIPIEKQEAIARRFKALEYAKAVPKPVTSKISNVWKSPTKAHEERQSLLAILQERHENEKRAIDAMRKDLQTKLKTSS
ncbi:uncharacterized protein LOC114524894 [Dendronephthya gigantea]|uniref:uncharacterized protein LOC114524894 n=1 Tax=Dendronephthya gigantea TaxID=151771 RepID=UPI00106968ED|nr:uncharacterized protein LOC114524894 [Dendronephthya gigantea]XP_028401911.1 uncharacterized protein LOC114524894 [Dendronephthya gigantea]